MSTTSVHLSSFLLMSTTYSFPPKNAKVHINSNNPSPSLCTASVFPTSVLAQSEIWDESVRNTLLKPRYQKKDLDDRRSKVGC